MIGAAIAMKMHRCTLLLSLLSMVAVIPLSATTWYVRTDGGTRYSTNVRNGQCNGQYNAPYPGTGVNRDCAFRQVWMLWADGSYNASGKFPGWGWVGKGGDRYVIDCPSDCRIGYIGPNSHDFTGGLVGDPYSSPPSPPSGSPEAHTVIEGSNWAHCGSDTMKAHLNPGFGSGSAFYLVGVSYVDLRCFDIHDDSSCGRSGQSDRCSTSYPLSDYANSGITFKRNTTFTTLTDISIHGMAVNGILGATGDGVVLKHVSVIGNSSSGWNLDDGSGQTGTGTLTLSYFTAEWNGCIEEYPVVDPVPYKDCTDDNSGGYGDGVGTASKTSNPAWIFNVDHSIAAYNTQDGFDLLHLQGNGSRLTITDSLAYGNMGQQLKVGAAGTAINNVLIGNCNALRQDIPGTPKGYNSKLSDFCRAADSAVVMEVQDGATTNFEFNTILAANSTALEIECNGNCTTAARMQYRNNLFVGFRNNAQNGYPNGGTDDYSNPMYLGVHGLFGNPGSTFDHNLTFHAKSSWACPARRYREVNALCQDPRLANESWPNFGYPYVRPRTGSPAIGAGVYDPAVKSDYLGKIRPNPPTIGALEP